MSRLLRLATSTAALRQRVAETLSNRHPYDRFRRFSEAPGKARMGAKPTQHAVVIKRRPTSIRLTKAD